MPKVFSKADRDRIIPRITEHLCKAGQPVKVMAPTSEQEGGFAFHPELFESRTQVLDLLSEAGFAWLEDFGSVDLLHEEYGLEVCGIQEDSRVQPRGDTLREGIPHWHYYGICFKAYGRDLGWKFLIHMFPRSCGNGRCAGAE